MKKMPAVVVTGIIARTPFAGVTWQFLHYLEGLRRLGCEVHYAEDTGVWPYDAGRGAASCSRTPAGGWRSTS